MHEKVDVLLGQAREKGRKEGREEINHILKSVEIEKDRLQKENDQLRSRLHEASLKHTSKNPHRTGTRPSSAPETMIHKAAKKAVAISHMKPTALVGVNFVIEGSGVDNPGPILLPRSSSVPNIVSKVPGLKDRTHALFVDGDLHELHGKERLSTLVGAATTL